MAEYLREDNRTITTAGVARRLGAFFLARRSSGGTQHGKWEFPGGKCEGNETYDRCLEREFAEEFDAQIRVGEELARVPFVHNDSPFLLIGFAIVFDTHPTEFREHSAAGWFSRTEAEALDLIDSDRKLLQCIPD